MVFHANRGRCVDYIPWTDNHNSTHALSMSHAVFDDLQADLAQQIREARLRTGLSQEALALQAEVDRTYV